MQVVRHSFVGCLVEYSWTMAGVAVGDTVGTSSALLDQCGVGLAA